MQDMLILATWLAMLTFNLGIGFQVLPVPFKRVKMLGPMLMRDSIFTLVSIASVSLVQSAVGWSAGTIQSGLDIDTEANSALIVSQLIGLDSVLFGIIAILNSTVILAPVAAAVASMLSPVLQLVTTAIVLWTILEMIIAQLPSIWLYFYFLGIVLVSVPLRFTHSIGTTAMAGSVAFAILLPLAPSFALSIQSDTLAHAIDQIREMRDEIQSNPLDALDAPLLISKMAQIIADVTASIVIALVAFPFAWLFTISIISKSIAELIGGSSVFDTSSYIIGTARQVRLK